MEVFWNSFNDELEKIAVHTSELERIAKKALEKVPKIKGKFPGIEPLPGGRVVFKKGRGGGYRGSLFSARHSVFRNPQTAKEMERLLKSLTPEEKKLLNLTAWMHEAMELKRSKLSPRIRDAIRIALLRNPSAPTLNLRGKEIKIPPFMLEGLLHYPTVPAMETHFFAKLTGPGSEKLKKFQRLERENEPLFAELKGFYPARMFRKPLKQIKQATKGISKKKMEKLRERTYRKEKARELRELKKELHSAGIFQKLLKQIRQIIKGK